ncbi:MAG: hypothetical protein QOF33_135, partial [Thermomicrobiales bacterium]|nr:hypothetical protein [Thermomicrobiales bacterium]
ARSSSDNANRVTPPPAVAPTSANRRRLSFNRSPLTRTLNLPHSAEQYRPIGPGRARPISRARHRRQMHTEVTTEEWSFAALRMIAILFGHPERQRRTSLRFQPRLGSLTCIRRRYQAWERHGREESGGTGSPSARPARLPGRVASELTVRATQREVRSGKISLCEQGTLGAPYLAADRSGGWVAMQGPSIQWIEAALASLPLHPYMDVDLTALLD